MRMATQARRINKAYAGELRPIILKQLLADCGINQAVIGGLTGLARTSINLVVNRGYIPVEAPEFKKEVEKFVKSDTRAAGWLKDQDLTAPDIWQPLGKVNYRVRPADIGNKISAGIRKDPNSRRLSGPATTPGDPSELTINWEVEMLNQETMKYFKIFRNPFIDDIQKDGDIFMSEEHRYIEAAMLDAAHYSGFLAVIGEVGSGKSVMRRKVVEQLRKDGNTLVIYPQIIDKTRLNAGSICDAIIMDTSDEKPKIKLEQKTRQVQKLLLDRSAQSFRSVLIVEEAHDLSPATLKYLKRFYELEDGYKKLLGIILVGQVELKKYFNESTHVDMREVIRRIQVAEIRGLNGNIGDYLSLKFRRVGNKLEDIFDPEAITALSKRLTVSNQGNKKISHAYPLVVNNYAAKAMNTAVELGEAKVTASVVEAI